MNGTLNSFIFSDEANSAGTSNSSRDMMSIRNIMDNSNANSENKEESGFGANLGNHSTNSSAYNVDQNSTNDADNSSSNNTTEDAQQESILSNSFESTSETSQEAEQQQSQEQQQPEQPAEQQESSEGAEPEQQPEPAPAPMEEDLSIKSHHLPYATHVDQTPFAHKIDLVADYQDSVVIMRSDETYGAASNLIKTVAIPPHTNVQPNEEGMQFRWFAVIDEMAHVLLALDEFKDGWLVKRQEESGLWVLSRIMIWMLYTHILS